MRNWKIFAIGFWILWICFGRLMAGWSWDVILYGGIGILSPLFVFHRVKEKLSQNRQSGFNPVSVPQGMELRMAWIKTEAKEAESFGFSPCDEFYLKFAHVDQIICVLEHPASRVNCVIVDTLSASSRQVKTLILVSRFDDERTLETINTAVGAKQRRPADQLIQFFPNARLETLLENHRQAIRYLEGRKMGVVDYPGKSVRSVMAKEFNKPVDLRFGSIIKTIFAITRPGSPYAGSIESQVSRGIITL